MGCMGISLYLHEKTHRKSTQCIHVGKYTMVPWTVWVPKKMAQSEVQVSQKRSVKIGGMLPMELWFSLILGDPGIPMASPEA